MIDKNDPHWEEDFHWFCRAVEATNPGRVTVDPDDVIGKGKVIPIRGELPPVMPSYRAQQAIEAYQRTLGARDASVGFFEGVR